MGIAQESNQYELTVNDSRYVISGAWLGESYFMFFERG